MPHIPGTPLHFTAESPGEPLRARGEFAAVLHGGKGGPGPAAAAHGGVRSIERRKGSRLSASDAAGCGRGGGICDAGIESGGDRNGEVWPRGRMLAECVPCGGFWARTGWLQTQASMLKVRKRRNKNYRDWAGLGWKVLRQPSADETHVRNLHVRSCPVKRGGEAMFNWQVCVLCQASELLM